jgi:hypothetical protein
MDSSGPRQDISEGEKETAFSLMILKRRPFPAENRRAEVPWSIPMNITILVLHPVEFIVVIGLGLRPGNSRDNTGRYRGEYQFSSSTPGIRKLGARR